MADYMFEESVCLLIRATWFKPLIVEDHEVVLVCDDSEDYYPYEDDVDEVYFHSSSLRISNRRWGDNGFVRAGRQEAKPVYCPNSLDTDASSSREPKKKEAAKSKTDRHTKRELKREAADKAAPEKRQQHLARLGRNLDVRGSQ